MLFLVIATTLVVAIYSGTTLNAQAASNHGDGICARAAAESGLSWFAWRLKQINRPRTTAGAVTASVANGLWPSLQSAIAADFASMTNAGERAVVQTSTSITSKPIATDGVDGSFQIAVTQHPFNGSDPLDQRFIRVTSTGTSGDATRVLSCDFRIDKKIRFAIAGRVPIQIGRNTLVEGPVGMATAAKFPPYLMLSDFDHLTTALTSKIQAFEAYLRANHKGLDNRIRLDTDEGTQAMVAGYSDTNNDGYIDEYDLFLKAFDKNSDGAISKSEFTNTSTGKLYDENLFAAIDSLDGPQTDTDPARAGFQDGLIDNRDGYAKVSGTVSMATSKDAWSANLATTGQTITDMMPGPIIPESPNRHTREIRRHVQ